MKKYVENFKEYLKDYKLHFEFEKVNDKMYISLWNDELNRIVEVDYILGVDETEYAEIFERYIMNLIKMIIQSDKISIAYLFAYDVLTFYGEVSND